MLYPATKWYFPAGTINNNISYINKLVTSSDFQDSAIDMNGNYLANNPDYFTRSNSSWNNKYFYKNLDDIQFQSTNNQNYTLSKVIQNAYNICSSNINTTTAKLVQITPNINLEIIGSREYILGSRFIWAYGSQISPNTSTLIFNSSDGSITMCYDSEYIYISNISAVISLYASSKGTFKDQNGNNYYPAQVLIEALGGSGTSYSYSYSYSPNSGGGISDGVYNGYVSNLYVDLYNKNLYQTIYDNLDEHNYVNEFHSSYISCSDGYNNYIVNKHYSQNNAVDFHYGHIARASIYKLLENNEDALYAWDQRVGTVGSMQYNPQNNTWGGMPGCTYTYFFGDTGPYLDFPWAIVIHELNITFSPNNELFILYGKKDTDNTYFFKQWITLINVLRSHFQINSASTSYQFINLKINGVSINRVNYTFEISTNGSFTSVLPTYVFFNYESSHDM